MGTLFDIDLTHFSEEEDDRLMAELKDCMEDPLFKHERVALVDLKEIVSRSPAFARHFLTLYQSYHQANQNFAGLAQDMTGDEAVRAIVGPQFPYEEVRDYFYCQNNYFDELDQAAEALAKQEKLASGEGEARLIEYLQRRHHITVVVDAEGERQRHFEPVSRHLTLSKLLSLKQRVFQLAHQICLLEHQTQLDDMIRRARFSSHETEAVCRVGLANYFAGALLMPYSDSMYKTQQERYDIERLQIIFNVSFEQVCHRLSTLQRPGTKGIPFYFVRVDAAGNISKRQISFRPGWRRLPALERPRGLSPPSAKKSISMRMNGSSCLTASKPDNSSQRHPAQGIQHLAQVMQIDRLLHKGIHSRIQATLAIHIHDVGRQRHYWRITQRHR